METSLFQQLKKIGIDEETAHQVSASLDPDYNASKKDVLVMQEAILRAQVKSDESFKELHKEIADVRAGVADVRADMADVRTEMRTHISDVRREIVDVRSELLTEIHTTINQQYFLTFGGLLMTIATVVAVNWYFH